MGILGEDGANKVTHAQQVISHVIYKNPWNYTQESQYDNEHFQMRNGYLCHPSRRLPSTRQRCQLTQVCHTAFTDCLPISENIDPWGTRTKPALNPAEGRQESRPEACPGAGPAGTGHARQARRHKHGSRARPGVHAAAVKSPGERDVPV